MKKYFCVSDIHSYYNKMITALKKVGYNKNNKNHILVVCGDLFDRGPDPVKVYEFIKNIPVNQRILIRGNHEYLLRDMIKRQRADCCDITNGTTDTVGLFVESLYGTEEEYSKKFPNEDYPDYFLEFRKLGIVDWILGPEWVDYFETSKYICVHSWVPLETHSSLSMYELDNYNGCELLPNWRHANSHQWEEATWGVNCYLVKHNLLPEKNKTMIVGHVAAKYFRIILDNEDKKTASNDLYIGHGVVALDGHLSSEDICNVFVFEE